MINIEFTKEQIEKLKHHISKMNDEQFKEFVFCRGFYDKVFFGDFFLKHWKGKKTPKFHKEIYDILDNEDTVAVICPRGHGKTTTLLIDIIHSLVYQTYKSQLYIASAGLGEESIGKIKQELETNQTIREIFGKLVPEQDKKTKDEFGAKKWRMKHIELLNGCTIETLSSGQNIRGKRPNRIVVDDINENKDVLNKAIVEKTRTWFFTSLYNTLLPGGKIAILGTIVGNLCMIKYCRDIKKWHTIEYQAIMDGKPLWEDQWDLKALEQRKKDIGTALFNQEFMNIPLSVENRVIKESWIKYYDYLPEEFDYKIMAIDPASETKEQNDFTGISVIGIKGENKYVLYAQGHKLSPNDLMSLVVAINNKYQPNKILFEKNKEATMGVMLKLNHNLPLELHSAHKDKMTRLLGVAGQIEFGNVYFNRRDNEDLIYQLLNFPDVAHDDVMDSLVDCLSNSNNIEESSVMIM